MARPETYDEILSKMHSGQWFGSSDSKNKVYANLEIYPVGGVTHDKPSESSLNTALATAQSDFDATVYARARASEYPSTETFLEAYTEKEISGDSTKWDAYIIAYNKVRSDNPKPG